MAVFAAALFSCRLDMHDQPRSEPYEVSRFFVDGRADRPEPEGLAEDLFLRRVLTELDPKRMAGTLDLLKRNARKLQVAGGTFLALVGIAIATGLWDRFIILLRPYIGGFETVL